MNLAHFYHAWVGGAWRDPLAEHLWALDKAQFDGEFHVGLVGPRAERNAALHELNAIRRPDSITQAAKGFEQVTLRLVRAYAQEHDGAVLYAHTKGAFRPHVSQDWWRRSMADLLIVGYRDALTHLRRHDTVGCHWLEPGEMTLPSGGTAIAEYRMFAGNFWIARCDYLRELPECPTGSRWDAEAWVGLAEPRVCDLLPGWPGQFPRARYGRLVASHT